MKRRVIEGLLPDQSHNLFSKDCADFYDEQICIDTTPAPRVIPSHRQLVVVGMQGVAREGLKVKSQEMAKRLNQERYEPCL